MLVALAVITGLSVIACAFVCALVVRYSFALVTLERRHIAEDRAAWATERGVLLQRIQAPASAVHEHVLGLGEPVAPSVALTDEELAVLAGVHSVDGDPGRVYEHELA